MTKFNFPPGPLTIHDYRVFLGAIHDGFTWHERDKSQYICPDLKWKQGTVIDVLFWKCIWYEPRYQPLIEEALLHVERDIVERQKKRAKGGQDSKESQEPPKKITKMTDFIRDNCEDTPSVSSKANRIHELIKKGKIKFMPKPINKPNGNETKLYDEQALRQIWSKLKEQIKSLPNLKG